MHQNCSFSVTLTLTLEQHFTVVSGSGGDNVTCFINTVLLGDLIYNTYTPDDHMLCLKNLNLR